MGRSPNAGACLLVAALCTPEGAPLVVRVQCRVSGEAGWAPLEGGRQGIGGMVTNAPFPAGGNDVPLYVWTPFCLSLHSPTRWRSVAPTF